MHSPASLAFVLWASPFLSVSLFAQDAAPLAGDLNSPPAKAASLLDRLDFSANMRVRMESTLDQPNGEDRHRGRLRFRIGATDEIADRLHAEFRVSTTSGTANNPHWDLGGDNGTDTLGGADLVLDRLSLTYDLNAQARLMAGKMKNPLRKNPVFGEWLLDDDIQPSGLAAVWSAPWEGDAALDLRLGHFVLDEENNAGAASDPALSVFQINYADAHEGGGWGVSSAYWNWSSEAGVQPFEVWNSVLHLDRGPWIGSVQYFENLEDNQGAESGLALGVRYGSGGTQGAGQWFGNYFDFEAGATLFGLGQDDLPLSVGAQGLDGFVAGYKYWWHDNTTLKLWALQADDSVDDPLRIRLDLDLSF